MYIHRAMEKRVRDMAQYFPVVMVCGPRQVGKTTLLQEVSATLDKPFRYVTLDYPQLRQLAKSDPGLFLQQYQPPLMIASVYQNPGRSG